MDRTARVVFPAVVSRATCIGVLLGCFVVLPAPSAAQREMDLGQVDARHTPHPRPNAFYILTHRPPAAPDPALLPPAMRPCAADLQASLRRLRDLHRRRSRARGQVTSADNADFEAEESIERAARTRCLGHLRRAPQTDTPRPIVVEFFHSPLEFHVALPRSIVTTAAPPALAAR